MNGPLRIKHYRHLLALLPQLPKVGRLCWRLWRDRRVPRSLKGMIVAIMVYVVSPIDLVPGFLIPVLGQLDDATLLMLGAYLFIRWSPPEVVAEHMASISTNFFSKFRPWLVRSAPLIPSHRNPVISARRARNLCAKDYTTPTDDRCHFQAVV